MSLRVPLLILSPKRTRRYHALLLYMGVAAVLGIASAVLEGLKEKYSQSTCVLGTACSRLSSRSDAQTLTRATHTQQPSDQSAHVKRTTLVTIHLSSS